MKKFLAMTLAMAMTLSLVACGAKEEPAPAPAPAPEQSQPAEPAPAPEVEEPYTSLDDFILWNDDRTLTTTGRGDTGENAVVSSGKYEASKIGKQIMEAGGNAVDAAVAVGFALGLVEPNATGLGGGGFMTMRSAETGEIIFLNFRECAPAAATPDMWQLDSEGKVIRVRPPPMRYKPQTGK